MNAVASPAGNKPDKLTLRPFPTDRIMLMDAALEPGTYDERIPVENILWNAAQRKLVVRIPCDACTAKKAFCDRDGRQCAGCAMDGTQCDWSEPKWVPLPKGSGRVKPKRSTATATKTKKSTDAAAGQTNTTSPSKGRPGRKPKAALVQDSDAPSSSMAGTKDVARTSPSKRKNAADDDDPTGKRKKSKKDKDGENKRHRERINAIREAAKASMPDWTVPEPKAYPYLHRSDGKRPPIWAESYQDLKEILPYYADRSADGIVEGWNALLLGVDGAGKVDRYGTAHEEDKWVNGEEGRVLELSFVREFSKAPLAAAEEPTAPHEPAPLGESVVEPTEPVAGPSSLRDLVPSDGSAPTVIQHPPSAPPVPSNVFVPSHVPPPPPACPLLAPPDEIAVLMRLYASRIPLLVLCSVTSPICPPCAVSDTAVVWLGFFGIERIEEDYPMRPELFTENWQGRKRWRVRLRWCFNENMDGTGAEQPWFGSAYMPRIPVAPELAMDPRRVRAAPAQRFQGYPQLAGRAPPSSADGINTAQSNVEARQDPVLQLDPALPGVAGPVQPSEDIDIDGEQAAGPPERPHFPEGSFVPANYPLIALPNAIYVNEARQGAPPKGWCCPCGRLNRRRFLSEWDCECGQTRPIRPLHSRALRPKYDVRSPIPDLEITSHAGGDVPPLLEGFEDGSRILHYPTAHATHVVLRIEHGETETVFEGLQTAPRFFGRGVPDAKRGDSAVHIGSQLLERERVKVSAVKSPLSPEPFGFVCPPNSRAGAPEPRELRDLRDLMDRALLLCAPDEDGDGDDVELSSIPTTAGKLLVGLMWLDTSKAFSIRLPAAAENVAVLALGANVLLSIPGRERPAPRSRETLSYLPQCFCVNLFHGDLLVLERLEAGEYMDVKIDGSAMLLMCY